MYGNSLNANRLSSYLTFEYIIKEDAKLVVVNYYQPQVGKWEDNRFLSDNSLIVNIISCMDLKVSFNLRYDSRPAETIKNADTFTRLGFSFKL